MSHEITHVVISMTTPVEIANVKTYGGVAAAVLVIIGFIAGALVF